MSGRCGWRRKRVWERKRVSQQRQSAQCRREGKEQASEREDARDGRQRERTYLVAVFANFHGLPLVRPAEDCASSRGAEAETDVEPEGMDADVDAEVVAGGCAIVVLRFTGDGRWRGRGMID